METIAKTDLENKAVELIEQTLEEFRVVDLDCRPGGRSLMRVFIERKDSAAAQVTLDNCAEASRKLDTVLESHNLFPGPYDLEVSSPGLERRLRLRSDFEQMSGRKVKLKLTAKLEGRGANLTGWITKVESGNVILKVDNQEVEVPLQMIKQANLVWEMDSKH